MSVGAGSGVTPIRVVFFSTWVGGSRPAERHLAELPSYDPRPRLRDPDDEDLLRMARLDVDWDGECLRAFSALEHPRLAPRPPVIADAAGLLEIVARGPFTEAVPWLVLIGQRPAAIAPVVGRLLAAFTARGGRVLYWAYDDASHAMDCFASEVAPYLSALIHDELPIADPVRRALPARCRSLHSSWVANVVPFSMPLREDAEERVVFLGSRLGLTGHRRRQIEALERYFGERFVCLTDHSVPVGDRGALARYKVHVCPEGRKFGGPAMRFTHTDRPFWAGCAGQVPVAEDSREGGRLQALADAGWIRRYPHGDIEAMLEACESALDASLEERRAIHDHFNREGTVGPIAAREIAAVHTGEG